MSTLPATNPISTDAPPRRPVLDVARMPPVAFDSRAQVWWGNTLLMVIESTTLTLLLASYFYLWRNFETWPPPEPNAVPPMATAVPSLGAATANALLLLVSLAPAILVDAAARKSQKKRVELLLLALTVAGGVSLALRAGEFSAVHVRWDSNAYGSIVWAILFIHLTYIIAGTLEVLVVLAWTWWFGLDERQAVDVTLTAAMWYWIVATDLVVYAVIFWVPRLAGG